MSPELILRQPQSRHNIQPVKLSYDKEANAAYLQLGAETLRPINRPPAIAALRVLQVRPDDVAEDAEAAQEIGMWPM